MQGNWSFYRKSIKTLFIFSVYFIDNINRFAKIKIVYIADIHLKNMGRVRWIRS